MPLKTIRGFKGLRQDLDYPELPENYCHELSNIDVDYPYGKMRVRDGSAKKYNDTFTNLLSAFEFKFESSGDYIIFFNDNGTMKNYIDTGVSGLFGSITLPTGATIASSFKNQYFGKKDTIYFTTGNAATNYLLSYSYIDRAAANNEGIFGDKEQFNSGTASYVCLKAQLIQWNGHFNNVNDIVKIGDYYYFSFKIQF